MSLQVIIILLEYLTVLPNIHIKQHNVFVKSKIYNLCSLVKLSSVSIIKFTKLK